MIKKPKKQKKLSDSEYYKILEDVALANHDEWNRYRIEHGRRPISEDEEVIGVMNDHTYDYRGYYNKYPNGDGNAEVHWPDEFKTYLHPTFSDESIYAPNNKKYVGRTKFNPNEMNGGHWYGQVFMPSADQWKSYLKESIPHYYSGKKKEYVEKSKDFYKRAAQYVAENEGFEPEPYDDYNIDQKTAAERSKTDKRYRYDAKKGKWFIKTVGYGWTDPEDLHSWTKEAANARLEEDVRKYDKLLYSGTSIDHDLLDENSTMAFADLMHQGGVGVFKKMPKMINAFNSGDTDTAYKELDYNKNITTTRNNKRKALVADVWLKKPELEPSSIEQKPNSMQEPTYDYLAPRVSTNVMFPIMQKEAIDQYKDYQNRLSRIASIADFMRFRDYYSIPNMMSHVTPFVPKPYVTEITQQ